MSEKDLTVQTQKQEKFEEIYQNTMQIKASLIDANYMFLEAGRATGKTTWLADRLINVGYDMPEESSFIAHKTYIALLNNVIPNIIAEFRKPIGGKKRSRLIEGIHYVKGVKDLPKHFKKPLYPIDNYNHSLILSNGHQFRMVASDQAESAAGASGVHLFVEEMKHNDGAKLRSRMVPTLRGGSAETRASHYYQGITGMSDTARVDMGEDDWFNEFEQLTNKDLIAEIASVALHVNEAVYKMENYKKQISETIDAEVMNSLRMKLQKWQRVFQYWTPILRRMRKVATYYIKASSFVNKDMLGFNFFKNELKTMDPTEFLAAIASIKPKKITDLFFSGFNNKIHAYSNSYIYDNIMKFNINDTFKFTAEYLKYFDPNKPLILGYDPGYFSSITVGQEYKKDNELRIIKELFCWIPRQQGELALMFYTFFGPYHKNKRIILYYDRAGNKSKVEHDRIVTDTRLLQAELKRYGFNVEMRNEKQRTIFYYEHFKLLEMILGERLKSFPRVRIDENECKNLVSAINLSPVLRKDGKIAMDKSSETLPYHLQPALSTQLPSSLMYMIFGLYSKLLPNEIHKSFDLIGHTVA